MSVSFYTLASFVTSQTLVTAFLRKPLLSFPQDLKPQIPVLQVLMCVPRYDNDIRTTVRLTGTVMLKWENESGHIRINEMS